MNVKEVLDSKNIAYKEATGDYVTKCLNPEHPDRNPSLRIDKITGMFNCFSCAFSGNIFNYFNINQSLTDIKILLFKKKIQSLRHISIYMPLGAEPVTQEFRGISASTLQKFEAFIHSDKVYEDRIVFPIRNILGHITGFVARHMYSDENPKYVIEPNHANISLYPAAPEIIGNSIILVEGIFDMLNLYDNGLTNTVCTFGTAFGSVKKKEKIAKNLKKLAQFKMMGATKLILLFDGDKPGRDAANNMEKIYKEDFIIENIELPEDQDPGKLSKGSIKQLKEYLYGKDSNS